MENTSKLNSTQTGSILLGGTQMLELARILLGPFPKTILLETPTHEVITVRKVSTCYYAIINKVTNRKYSYKKITSFERALKKHNINRHDLESNITSILMNYINFLLKEDISKDDIDFFSIKKVLFTPNESILLGKNKLRSLVLRNGNDNNYFEMLYYANVGNKLVLTAKTEIGCTEIVKVAKRENIPIEDIIKTVQEHMTIKYNHMKELSVLAHN